MTRSASPPVQKSGAWRKYSAATRLLFRAFGTREFVALEVSEYIKRLATFGPSNRLEESIQGEEAARELMARFAVR